ncbi:membrane transporter (predicted) [Sugiyamaella lignohabitans]|uniref:Membrane transporter (Predicted) n=1 Tax=Sugiyamaella lignohabitans TaxID=796027 RepID=A0A167F2B3_9ASCO|nr:membrane transporter (predicted) [Sugiyamaella lignohabitans]ANB14733.1 membrane transporter (predicted) [Sugiyamaella lignohabitans]
MFDALSGLGAGGQRAASVSLTDEANAALYACFAVVGFFGGSIVNTLGPRYTFFLGTLGYTIYIGSLWSLDRNGNRGFVVAGGVLCGISAGLLWSVHGMITMAYPEEKDKAKGFAITWSLLSIGATLGGLIPLLQNLHRPDDSGVNTGTYLGFLIVMLVGVCVSLTLCDPKAVRRKSGLPLEDFKQTDFRTEIIGVFKLVTDKKIMMLLPAFFASNFFYSYQFGMNAFYFSLRTRSLNSLIYWLTQVIGTFFIGAVLDNHRMGRRKRGLLGLAIVSIFVLGTWAGGVAFQVTFTRKTDPPPNVDWTSSKFGGPFVLYFMYGMSDAMWQSWCYWIMGSLTNETFRLARYAGFYKGIQSAGSAISFGIDAAGTPFMNEVVANFILMGCSIPLMAYVACQTVETNYGLESEIFDPTAPLPVTNCDEGSDDVDQVSTHHPQKV